MNVDRGALAVARAGCCSPARRCCWLARQPLFAIRAIRVDGDVGRNSVVDHPRQRRAAPRRQLLHARPRGRRGAPSSRCPGCATRWCAGSGRTACAVRLEEHRPVALWGGGEPGSDEAGQQLRRGVRGQPRRRRGRQPADAAGPGRQRGAGAGDARPAGAGVRAARRARRGAAAVGPRLVAGELDTGAEVELGRGSDDEVVARTARFVATLRAGDRALPAAARVRRPAPHTTATRCA